jgi:hypothetical protein
VFRNKATSGSLTTGSFQARQDYTAASGSSPNCVAVADINGDGKADIIPTIPTSTDSYSLLINDAINASPSVPVDNNLSANTIAENSANGTTVGVTGFSTDPEGSTVSYSLSDDAGGRFAINSSTGVVTVADGFFVRLILH